MLGRPKNAIIRDNKELTTLNQRLLTALQNVCYERHVSHGYHDKNGYWREGKRKALDMAIELLEEVCKIDATRCKGYGVIIKKKKYPDLPIIKGVCDNIRPPHTCAKCSSGEVTTRYMSPGHSSTARSNCRECHLATIHNSRAREAHGPIEQLTIYISTEHNHHECTCGWQWSTPCDDAVERAAEERAELNQATGEALEAEDFEDQDAIEKVNEPVRNWCSKCNLRWNMFLTESSACPRCETVLKPKPKPSQCKVADPNEGTEATPEDYLFVGCKTCEIGITRHLSGICERCRDKGAANDD